MPLPCAEVRFCSHPVESNAHRKSPASLRCATQTVRDTIHAFEQKGLGCLKQESSRPKTVQAQFDQAKCEALRTLLHQRPRIFGKATSQWTLELAAEVCFEQRLTVSQVSIETIRLARHSAWSRMAACETLDHES
jgi:transposase